MHLIDLATQPVTVEWTTSPYMLITLLFAGILALYFIYFSLNSNNDQPKPQEEEKEPKKEEVKKKAPKEKKTEPKEKPAEVVIDPLQYHALKGHTKEINFALFSPDGKFVVSTGDDHHYVSCGQIRYQRKLQSFLSLVFLMPSQQAHLVQMESISCWR